jgi:hypothetical protein
MRIYSKISTASLMAVLALNAQAVTYNDSTGEIISGAHIDIASVEVNNTATDLIFKINLAGDPVATDWGKYLIGLDTTAGGDVAGNAWARPIGMSSGMDYWVGTWADSGNGAEVYKHTGSWGIQNATYALPGGLSFSKNSSSVTITYPYASLGLSPGSTFVFDVYTTAGGGGDGAIDALGNPAQSIANWGDYYNSGTLVNQYTIPAVPEPTSLALLGIGASLIIGRIRRR